MNTYDIYKQTKKYVNHTLLTLSVAKYLLKCITSLNVSADDVSIHCCIETLDIHSKHVASHLHVEVRTWLVFSDIDSRYSKTSSLSVSVFTSNELPA